MTGKPAKGTRYTSDAQASEYTAATGDDMPTVDDLLDLEVAGWKPEPGDKVIGLVAMIQTAGEGGEYGAYPLLTIRKSDGSGWVAVHAFHNVLRGEIARAEVGVGDVIGIKYNGKVEGGKFGKYENYRVINHSAIKRDLGAE